MVFLLRKRKKKIERKEKNMKIFKTKTMISLIAITLMLTIAFSIAFSPDSQCTTHVHVSIKTWCMCQFLLQLSVLVKTLLLLSGSDKLPPTALGDYGDRFYFDVNIIKPDGTNDTIIKY